MPERKSERKRLSNVANAQKSTGPKSPEGKARCAQNARKHGILANEVVVKGGDGAENSADFAQLVADLHANKRVCRRPTCPAARPMREPRMVKAGASTCPTPACSQRTAAVPLLWCPEGGD